MINDNEAGISCTNCGYEIKALTPDDADKLKGDFKWVGGDPICPECGESVYYEDYLVDDE